MADTHTIMPKKLAQALMEAGVQHFDGGGMSPQLGQAADAAGTAGFGGFGYLGQQIFGQTNSGILGGNMTASAQAPQEGAGLPLTGQDLRPRIGTNDMQQQAIYNNQSNLANQLMAQSQGQGPNPALAQLNQTTGQNVQNQGALMASQRGASANPALIARQAAMQGANTQQQAVGQAATLGAQQQLAAEGQAAGVYNNMGQQTNQQQSTLQGAIAAQNASAVNQELGYGNMQTNASMANAQSKNGMFGGLLQGGAAGAAMAFLNKGGEVPKYSNGGIERYDIASPPPALDKPGGGGSGGNTSGLGIAGAQAMMGSGQGIGDGGPSDYGNVSELPSGGTPGNYPMPLEAKGGMPFSTALLNGGKVPGQAVVKGNSERNDNQPALLSPEEIVLPRSVTLAKDAPARAADFVRQLQAKKRGGGYGDVIKAKKLNRGGCA